MRHLDLTGLEDGEFTQRDEVVKTLAEHLRVIAQKRDFSPRRAISEYVARMPLNEKRKYDLYRKRTASQILQSGYITGCTDIGITFVALARELGIPSLFVETLETDWLKDHSLPGISSHAFADINANGKWAVYEPCQGFTNNLYVLGGRRYTPIGKGIDFSQIYLFDGEEFQTTPTNLSNLLDVAKNFRGKK